MSPAKEAKGAAPAAAGKAPEHDDVVYLEFDDWREKAADDPDSLAGYGVRLDAPAALAKLADPADPYKLDYVISTEEQDRDGDVIHVAGWDAKDFFRGGPGPVLFGHDRKSLPVAKCPTVNPMGQALVARAQFPTAEEAGYAQGQPFLANTVRCLSTAGFLKNTSVGFLPTEWTYNEELCGYEFHKQELLEWSIVPVPANAGCFQLAASKGIDMSPLDEWARQALDEVHGRKGLYVTRSKLEMVLRACGLAPDVKFFDLAESRMRGALKHGNPGRRGFAQVAEAADPMEALERALGERGVSIEALASLVARQVDAPAAPAPAAAPPAAPALAEAPPAPEAAAGDDVVIELAADDEDLLLLELTLDDEFRNDLKETLRAGFVGALNEQTAQTGKVW